MLQLYFTAKAQQHIRTSWLNCIPEAIAPDDMQTWHINIITVQRIKLVQAMHEASRLALLLYDYRKADSEHFDVWLQQHLSRAISRLFLPNPFEEALQKCERITAHNRSVTAHMKEHAWVSEYWLCEQQIPLSQELVDLCNLREASYLRKTKADRDFYYPTELWRELLAR